jgi:hypothetical protein
LSYQSGIPEKTPGAGGNKSPVPVSSGPVSPEGFSGEDSSPHIFFKHLAFALGIPQDALSSRLLSFFRYFSLPLNGEQIAKLRREVLASLPAGVSAAEGVPQNRGTAGRGALALAAAAAADKGVVLSPEALAEYAAAINPEEGQTGDEGFSGEPGNPEQDPPQERKKKKEPPHTSGETETLRKKIETLPAHQPLLDLLNRLPGKNAQHWMLFPFTFSSGGVAFKVSLRILLTEPRAGYDGTRLILDILSKKQYWFFCFSGYGTSHSRADIGVFPPLPPEGLKNLERELRGVLGDFAEEIHTENREKNFLAEEENWDTWPFLNEEA